MREMRERERGWCAVEEMRSRFARVIDDTLSGQTRRNKTFADDPDAYSRAGQGTGSDTSGG